MKKKFLIALTAVFVLGLAMAVYAYKQTNNANKAVTASCCGKADSCPVKNHNASKTNLSVSCCDREDCCCKTGDACPLKNKQAQTETKEASVVSGENCCNGAGCCKHKS
jgi:hypothetical protein